MGNKKIYRFFGEMAAIDLLRPNAIYTVVDREFVKWDDERPQPTWEEIDETLQKMKDFEDSIPTIWKEDQIKMFDKINNLAIYIPATEFENIIDGYHRLKHMTYEDFPDLSEIDNIRKFNESNANKKD